MTKDILLITCDMETFHHINREINIEKGSVYHVDTVDEAIWKMQMHSFCLVILDIPLSDRTGFERIEAIRQISPIPILVLSNERGVVERVKALENGADDFLQKPYEEHEAFGRGKLLISLQFDKSVCNNQISLLLQNVSVWLLMRSGAFFARSHQPNKAVVNFNVLVSLTVYDGSFSNFYGLPQN